MQNETGANWPTGLYYSESTDTYIGALDESQAAAIVRYGYTLVKEGVEAARLTDEDIEAKKAEQQAQPEVVAEPTVKMEEDK